MPNTPKGMRICPTRSDGEEALFAHVISTSSCQERQRGHFHKCHTCSFRNGAEQPPPGDLIPRPEELPSVPRKRAAKRPAAMAQPARGA